MEYEHISEEDKKTIVDSQLKKLEADHFALLLLEPNKLQDSQNHVSWHQAKTGIEQSLERLRVKSKELL
jgi:hypothetical protein